MKKTRIAFFDTKPYDRQFFEQLNSAFNFEISYLAPRLGEDTVLLAQNNDVVCVFVNDILNERVVNSLYTQGIQLIALRSAGYNNVDLNAVYNKVHVVRVPEYSPHAVAEHTLALILTLNRKTHKAYNRTRDLNFSINGFLGYDLFGKTAGIIGTGRIGKCVVHILRGFGMEVLVHDMRPDESFAKQSGCVYTDLDDIYRRSDIISLHCPLTPETVHLINTASIAKMKKGVMIINTGRGKLIKTVDLIKGLLEEKIGYAGLDVYEEENDFFFEDRSSEMLTDEVLARLLTFPNVLITSHQAFFTQEALTNIARTTFENIQQFIDGAPLKNEICYRCGERQDCPRTTRGRCF